MEATEPIKYGNYSKHASSLSKTIDVAVPSVHITVCVDTMQPASQVQKNLPLR